MIEVKCPTCGKQLEIDSKYLGQSGRCNACGGLVYAVESKVMPEAIPKSKPKRRSLAEKMALCLLSIPILLGLMVLNAFVYFDVSKPISNAELAAAAAMPLMHDTFFEEIRAEVSSQYLTASSQRLNSYLESIKGRTVSWYGLVVESRQRLLGGFGARRKLIGGYEVWIDTDRNGLQDVIFDVSGATARSLSVGQCIAFEGTIHSLSSFQVNLVDTRITTTYASEIMPVPPTYAPAPIPEELYYQFTLTHRSAAISALWAAGFPTPQFVGFKLDMILVDIELSDSELKKLGGYTPEVGQRAVLAVRNAIYVLPGSDPDWNYAVRIMGESPGPDLELIRGGSFLLGKTGTLQWLNGQELAAFLQ